MKRKSARYLGMTGTQIGILAGLSFVAMLSMCGAVWLLLSMSSSPDLPAVAAPVDTPIPATARPTAASQSTAEPTNTITPTAPVAVTMVPPGGWVEFKTQGADIWLPDNFVGGDMLTKRSETIKQIQSKIKMSQDTLTMLQKVSDKNVLTMVEVDKDRTSLTFTSVSVFHVKTDGAITLADFVKEDIKEAETSVPVVVFSQKKLTIVGHEALRLELETRQGSRSYSKIIYYIKDGADVWTVGYGFDPAKIFDMQPIIDQSIQTFNLAK